MKYYAVRRGTKTGIFNSWDECKSVVSGYSGAEYKSFSTEDEARLYLKGINSAEVQSSVKGISSLPLSDDELYAYVDGSYDYSLGRYAFGCVFLKHDGSVIKRKGSGDNPQSLALRNISGEMLGAMYAVRVAIKSGFKKVTLFYDYEGIERWATGSWRTNNELTAKYANEMQRLANFISISYVKVAAHSNNTYNDMVDSVAKNALRTSNGIPKIDSI